MTIPDSDFDAEVPTFWLGAAGFSLEQRTAIEACLHRQTPPVHWQLSQFRGADAWLVNGAKCRLLANGNLRVAPGMPSEANLNLDLQGVDRPVAFATPIAPAELEALCTFDADSRVGIQGVLAQFDASLRFARAQFLLGSQVVERGATLRHGIFHVSYRHQLVATMDFRRREAALWPHLDPAELQHARWSRRPDSAQGVPSGFIQSSPTQLAWTYSLRSQRDLLPPRYREHTIHYRDVPRVPLSWLRDSHLRILRALSSESATLQRLQERTGENTSDLERDLSCLFYAGAITTTASKAAKPGTAPRYDSHPPASEEADAFEAVEPRLPQRADPTVPATLKPL